MLFERPVPGDLATLVDVRFTRVTTGEDDGDALRDEFRELVRSADLVCAAFVTASRDKPHPRWFVGTGKLDELASVLAATASTLVVFNHELTPAQQRNLEERLECRVMTRTELILHIFADRARTHEGNLQVQLAQLTHAQTRLIRGWTHLDRQTGVGGAGGRGAGGRIGGGAQRGAGETQLEMDQRMLAVRVRQVRTRLERVRKRRRMSRRRRLRSRIPTVALAGYTNAGKSTLFNA
ncbi:MAG: GTPase HflX, partial [Gammaproteobacteria bacterium]|nr:GTPase HflX [Gammaproteobacteria bacterium]